MFMQSRARIRHYSLSLQIDLLSWPISLQSIITGDDTPIDGISLAYDTIPCDLFDMDGKGGKLVTLTIEFIYGPYNEYR